MPRNFMDKLALYAQLAVRKGVNVQPGQELLISADVNDTPFVRLIVAEAYKAGAKHVQVLFGDDQNTLSRYRHASDEAMNYVPTWLFDGIERAMNANAARLVVFGGDPALLREFDPSKVAAYSALQGKALERVSKLITGFAVNWCIVGASSPAWSKAVFPHEPDHIAIHKLWDAIFAVSRVDEEDPIGAWVEHQNDLERRAGWLTGLHLTAVRFRGPGTELEVGLADDTRWIGGWGDAANGVRCSPNIPTEEVFTVPHRLRVDGHVTSTKPLSLRGQIIDGIRIEFSGGEVVKASAAQGEEALQRLLQTDDGARRLGEVALVPASSPVSKAGALFFNTLYDENAACHIALGRSIDECFFDNAHLDEEQREAKGGNASLVHVDWMIGSEQVDVDGLRADGSSVPVLRQGEWVVSGQ